MQNQNIDESIRPWGQYFILDEGVGFKVKRIVVKSGQRLSYQRHKRRSEHWTVVSGEGLVTLNDHDEKKLPGDTVDIPSGTKHRMANPGKEDLVFIEVQNGNYLEEDDIEHLQDDYGRLGSGRQALGFDK